MLSQKPANRNKKLFYCCACARTAWHEAVRGAEQVCCQRCGVIAKARGARPKNAR